MFYLWILNRPSAARPGLVKGARGHAEPRMWWGGGALQRAAGMGSCDADSGGVTQDTGPYSSGRAGALRTWHGHGAGPGSRVGLSSALADLGAAVG